MLGSCEDVMSGASVIVSMNLTGLLTERTSQYRATPLLGGPGLVGVSLLILVSLGVNITVILSYLRCPRLHTPNNIHVVSLAGADTLVAAISMPITAIKMSRNESLIAATVFCSWWPYFDFVLANISIFNLVNIAVDRYRAVCWPFAYSQEKAGPGPRLKCGLAWVASVLLSLPIILGEVNPDTCFLDMSATPWIQLYLPLVCFIIPSVIIILLYVIIAVKILQKTRIRTRSSLAITGALQTVTTPITLSTSNVRGRPLEGGRSRRMSRSFDTGLDLLTPGYSLHDNHHLVQSSPSLNITRPGRKVNTPASSLPLILGSRKTSTHSSMSDFLEDPLARLRAQALRRVHTHVTRERRLAGVTCLLVTVFICCYLPFWTVYICLAFIPSCPAPSKRVVAIIQWLTLASAALNPIIYTVFNTDFRRAIRHTLALCCTCWRL